MHFKKGVGWPSLALMLVSRQSHLLFFVVRLRELDANQCKLESIVVLLQVTGTADQRVHHLALGVRHGRDFTRCMRKRFEKTYFWWRNGSVAGL